MGRKGSRATLAGKRAGGSGSRVKVAHVRGKGILVSSEEAGFYSLWQLIGVRSCQVANLVLHGVDACQEDRLLIFVPLLVPSYQVGAVDAALWDVLVLSEAGGVVLQASRMRVGYCELVGVGGAGLLGLFPASRSRGVHGFGGGARRGIRGRRPARSREFRPRRGPC